MWLWESDLQSNYTNKELLLCGLKVPSKSSHLYTLQMLPLASWLAANSPMFISQISMTNGISFTLLIIILGYIPVSAHWTGHCHCVPVGTVCLFFWFVGRLVVMWPAISWHPGVTSPRQCSYVWHVMGLKLYITTRTNHLHQEYKNRWLVNVWYIRAVM